MAGISLDVCNTFTAVLAGFVKCKYVSDVFWCDSSCQSTKVSNIHTCWLSESLGTAGRLRATVLVGCKFNKESLITDLRRQKLKFVFLQVQHLELLQAANGRRQSLNTHNTHRVRVNPNCEHTGHVSHRHCFITLSQHHTVYTTTLHQPQKCLDISCLIRITVEYCEKNPMLQAKVHLI